MAVARVEANSPEEACRIAAGQVALAGNHRLSAEPAEQVDAREWEMNLTARTHG
jgi:hypothetical protein